MKRLLVLTGAAAGLLILVGCSTGGSPFPAPTSTAGQSTGGDQSTTSTANSGGTSLASLDPCSLLNASEASNADLPSSGQADQVGTSRTCDYQSTDYVVLVGIRTDGGLSAFNNTGGVITSPTIGSHQAKQQTEGPDSCVIAIGVTATSRVDVQVTASGSLPPCPEAQKVAQAVEPKLPPAS